MKVEQEEVTTAITAGRSVAHGDDTAAAEATVRLARLAGPDAVKFLRRVTVTEGGWASVPPRVRASVALLDVGGYLGERSEDRKGPTVRPSGTTLKLPGSSWRDARNGRSR